MAASAARVHAEDLLARASVLLHLLLLLLVRHGRNELVGLLRKVFLACAALAELLQLLRLLLTDDGFEEVSAGALQ